MPRILTDDEVAQLLVEVKPLPSGWKEKLIPRDKHHLAHKQRDLMVSAISGHVFRIILRQAVLNPDDFSIILVFRDTTGEEYRLSRFNGKHPSDHTNKIEKRDQKPNSSFRNVFHIHRATERYQLAGFDIVGYAEPTTAYNSFESALRAFVDFYKFTRADEETSLFDSPGGK